MKHLATLTLTIAAVLLTACEKQTATPSNCPVPPEDTRTRCVWHIRPTGVIGTEFQYRFFDSDGVDFICAGVSGEPFEVTVPLDEIGVMQYRDTLGAIQYREIAPVAGDTSLVDYLPATRL